MARSHAIPTTTEYGICRRSPRKKRSLSSFRKTESERNFESDIYDTIQAESIARDEDEECAAYFTSVRVSVR
jgi:hypothetical protein